MVLCGPCVVMMPTNGAFQRRDTRIPFPSSRNNPDQDFRIDTRNSLIKRPQVLPSTSQQHQEIIRRPPSASSQNKFQRHENRTVNPSIPSPIPTTQYTPKNPTLQYSPKKENTSHVPKYKPPRKADSLVLSDNRGKYVGTKPLNPISANKLLLQQPATHSTSNQRARINSQQTIYQLPKKQNPTSNWPTSSSIPKGTGIAAPVQRRADGSNKCMSPPKLQYSQPLQPRTNSSPRDQPFSGIPTTGKKENSCIPKRRIEISADNFGAKRRNSTLPRRVKNCTSIVSPRHSYNGMNVTKEHLPKLNENNHDQNQTWYQPKIPISIPDTKIFIHQDRVPKENYYTTPTPNKLSETQFREQKKSHTTPNFLIEINGTNEYELPEIMEDTEDMLDFSLEGCEGLASKESPFIEDKMIELVEAEQYDSEEESSDKDIVTVIPNETMQKSDDTIADSLGSLEESVTKTLPETIEEETEECITLDFKKSPQISADKFLVQSFQKLQKEIKEKKHIKEDKILGLEFNAPKQDPLYDSKHDCDQFLSKQNSQSSDDCDYIDIDCDVQPMQPLNRLLVYGYGNRLPVRARSVHDKYRYSYNFDRHQRDQGFEDDSLACKRVSREELIPSDFRETYWDYYLAKNKIKTSETDRRDSFQSISDNIEKNCACPSNEPHYDPEILLAQVAHPKSLKNATFNEYSSHIKSSIIERLAFQNSIENINSNDLEYGSCIDVSKTSQPLGSVDPGYYSESDVAKLKKGMYQGQDIESEDEFDNDNYPSYPTLTPSEIRKKQIEIGTQTSFHYSPPEPDMISLANVSSDNYLDRINDMDLTNKDRFPYLNYRHSANVPNTKSIGENPWLDLLPDITPPRTPLAELISTRRAEETMITHSPSITSLPVWSSLNESGTVPDYKPSKRKDMKQHNSETRSSTSSLSNDSSNIKKSRIKSFLPTFFRKKSSQKSNPETSQSPIPQNPETLNPPPMSNIYSNFNTDFSIYENCQTKEKAYSQLRKKSNASLLDSVAPSEFSNSSSSSSSSTKSKRSTSSQDSVLTVIRA